MSGIGQITAPGPVSNPGSMSWAFCRLRTKSPAPIRSRNENATWVTSMAFRRLKRPGFPAPPASSLRVGATSVRVDWRAGANPKKRPARTETTAVKARTCPSSSTTKSTGTGIGGWNDRARRSAHWATTHPARPPSPASSRVSTSSCRTRRPRPAPRARRRAISLRRSSARARRKDARLVQAISRTIPTTASIKPATGVRKRSTMGWSATSLEGRADMIRSSFDSGKVPASAVERVNCPPVNCIPSPLSPAKRTTTASPPAPCASSSV